jgi:hypothetical protein
MRAHDIITAAQRAYAKGSCLKAGKYIDDAYRAIGRRRLPQSLRRLDEKFEHTCVRKHPKGS